MKSDNIIQAHKREVKVNKGPLENRTIEMWGKEQTVYIYFAFKVN